MHKAKFLSIAIIVFSALSGCSMLSVVSDSQVITLQTHPANAQCVLKNDKGQWTVANTPGAVKVARSNSPLSITCSKAGYQTINGAMQPQVLNVHHTMHNDGTNYSYQNFIDVTLIPTKNNK